MADTILFLGAGATSACKGPLTVDILPGIYARAKAGAFGLGKLAQFLEQQFHVQQASSKYHFPGLPLLLSLLDTALERRQAFNAEWDLAAIAELRQQVEFGIYYLLEEQLEKSPTNNHWQMLTRLYPDPNEQPTVLSTNYDLIVDTALMSLSGSRSAPPGEGRLPDYRCHISTPLYQTDRRRFGTLLKLHGSLNWLYCTTCARLEIGKSQAKLYLNVLDRMLGPDLHKAFTPDGDPCPACRTPLRPLLIAPSHLKYYRNPHLSQVWFEAERVLREAKRVIFVGYSLPEDDVEVIYLLKRALARTHAPDITVVEFDRENPNIAITEHSAGRRYRTLFGDAIDWHACGLDAWLAIAP